MQQPNEDSDYGTGAANPTSSSPIHGTAIPKNIHSVNDARPYIEKCITALMDDENYSIQINGLTGCVDLCGIANDILKEMGFGGKVVKWITHPFHWLLTSQPSIATYHRFKEPQDGVDGLWVLDREKIALESVDSLTDRFIEKYGTTFLAKIKCIREDPSYCNS